MKVVQVLQVVQVLVVVVVIFISSLIDVTRGFKWKNCGSSSSVVQIKRIQLSPEAPKLSEKVSIEAEFELSEPIESGSKSILTLRKYAGRLVRVPVKIPCIMGYGSCTTDLCSMFSGGTVCEFLKGIGSTCSCPLSPGTYKTDKPISLKLPSLRRLGAMIAKGRYRIKWQWISPQRKTLACIDGEIRLQ